MLFGLLVGVVDYFAGNAFKGTAEKVMLMMGFNTHEYSDESFLTITIDKTIGGVAQD